jgi:hypothetical protein
VYVWVRQFELWEEPTNFYTTGYGSCTTGGHSIAVYFSVMQPVITWRTSELAWLKGYLLLAIEIMYDNKSGENTLPCSGNIFIKCQKEG